MHKENNLTSIFINNFLGNSPEWFKYLILGFLLVNPLVYFLINHFIAGWLLVIEFIFTLAMTLKCYPLQSGGLLALEALIIGMTSTELVKHEISTNFEVILLLIFMVAGISFIKDLLLIIFANLFVKIRSKIKISLAFCISSAFLSAFLDALTVIAVIINVCVGFYSIYHQVASDKELKKFLEQEDNALMKFRYFLQNIVMHSAIGTALGGVLTMVGEPQNLIIAEKMQWSFVEFFIRMLPVTAPVFTMGLITCYLLEKYKIFGYGEELPIKVRTILTRYTIKSKQQRTTDDNYKLTISLIVMIWLIINLALHTATVGIIGLSVIILATSFKGIIKEHELGKAFTESLPFTALLTVFFIIVAVIIDQKLFNPMINFILSIDTKYQPQIFYLMSGLLSSISDNVFVATIYIDEAKNAFLNKLISKENFELIAVAINTGTNIPSIATPNGQAAFLFLLTSSLTPLIKLSYIRMLYMAFPYTISLTITGLISVILFIPIFNF